jgi:hypothetical protein
MSDLLKYDPDRKMILIDFDGVIHSYKSGWITENHINDGPLPGAIDWLASLVRNKLLDVRIFSNRCNSHTGINVMRAWLTYHGFPIDLLPHLAFQPGKPKAHLIIDDRALRFNPHHNGEDLYLPFNERRLINFTPWYYDHPEWNRK